MLLPFPATMKWSSTRTSIKAKEARSVCMSASSARLGSTFPDGWLCAFCAPFFYERIKRRYFAYLKEAWRHNEPSVDAVAKALDRFEVDTKHRDFKFFRFEQAIAFKRHLNEQNSVRTGERRC